MTGTQGRRHKPALGNKNPATVTVAGFSYYTV